MDKEPTSPHVTLCGLFRTLYDREGKTQRDAARDLGISPAYMGDLLHGRRKISAEVALKMEREGWASARALLVQQVDYDLWVLREREE